MTPPVRILIWFWSGGGGGSQFAVNLAHRLSEQFGKDVVTLSLRADDPTIETAARRGLHVLPARIVSDRRRPLATFASLAGSARVLAAHVEAAHADVVVVPMNFAAAAPLSLTLRKPLVYFAHDPEPHPGDFEVTAQRITQAHLMRRARTVVAMSRYSADRLAAQQTAVGKIRMAPLSSVFEPAPIDAVAADRARLLFVGRMIHYKGVDILADALASLRSRDDWRLVVAGDGPALTDAAIARFSMPQVAAVRRARLTPDEIDTMICGCDVVLAPYRSASQSGVVSQALAFGKPVVTAPVGALPEQIGGGAAGWIAESCAPSAFAAALTQVLEVPSVRLSKAQAAHDLARAAWEGDHWSWLQRDWSPWR